MAWLAIVTKVNNVLRPTYHKCGDSRSAQSTFRDITKEHSGDVGENQNPKRNQAKGCAGILEKGRGSGYVDARDNGGPITSPFDLEFPQAAPAMVLAAHRN